MSHWIDRLLQADVQQFISEHRNDDLAKLALSHKATDGFPTPDALLQIELRQKAKTKLPEWFENESIIYPTRLSLEQCSSAHMGRYKQRIIAGKRLVDLTGGLGVDTYYLSEKFDRTDYVDQDEQLVEAARHNFGQLQGSQSINCHQATAEDFISTLDGKVNYFFIDPARRSGNRKTYFLEDTFPNITELHEQLLDKANGYLLKTSPMLDIKQAIKSLSHVAEVHVVSVDNECKELLFHINHHTTKNPRIIATDLRRNKWETLEFDFHEETETEVSFAEPLKYLYEPNAAIIKAGAFKVIAKKYGLNKLQPNTHLYTSDDLVNDFPGRVFQLVKVIGVDKKSINREVKGMKANLASRNFPTSVADLKKKWLIKDGGDQYLFATTLHDDSKAVLLCKKLTQ